MTLIETEPRTEELLVLSDTELESWFADAGLGATGVAHCDNAGCAICFRTTVVSAQAA